MNKIYEHFKTSGFCEAALLFSLLLIGGFNEFASCFICALCCAFLFVRAFAQKKITVNINPVSASVFAILLGYLVTVFYAVDSGAAFLGFMKFLPVAAYLLLLMQEDGARERIKRVLPYFALVLGALCAILMYIPPLSRWFSVAGRLAGTFQYPNSFAMLLLAGELCALSAEKLRAKNLAAAFALLVLILLTGSRAVFVLTVISDLLIVFFRKGRRAKLISLGAFAAFSAAAAFGFFFLRENEFFGRFFALSLSESTFAGRLLYYLDALPLVVTHPFGLGYMGHYYLQQSIQTGLYSVKFIHNDVLQLLLDVGWIPAALFVFAIFYSLFSRRTSASSKIILAALFAHCLFDFDLQFTSMFFVLLAFCDYSGGKAIILDKKNIINLSFITLSGLLSLYFGVALTLSYLGNYGASRAMYPFDTETKIAQLVESEDIETQDRIADEILSQNKNVQIAYSAKARYAYSQGDFENMIKYKHTIFRIAPFSCDEYEDYCYMLIQGVYLYTQAGDTNSADTCKKELIDTKRSLGKLGERLSELGKIIKDQPKTELTKELADYIEKTEAEYDK